MEIDIPEPDTSGDILDSAAAYFARPIRAGGSVDVVPSERYSLGPGDTGHDSMAAESAIAS